MKNVLVAFSTNSGSTEGVAKAISETLEKNGSRVTVSSIDTVNNFQGFDAVIIGAPMILGWHRKARSFVKQHRAELSRLPVAYFCTAMSLTTLPGSAEFAVPVFLDPMLVNEPKKPNRPNLKERYTLVDSYLKPILNSAPEVKPVSVAFFGGRLDLFRLKLLQMLFVMVIIGAQPGDMRNWSAIQEWAGQMADRLS